MRDQTIAESFNQVQRRLSMTLAQFKFLQTRQQAMEQVLWGSTLWERVVYAFNPGLFKVRADLVQKTLIDQFQNGLREAAAKPHIERV